MALRAREENGGYPLAGRTGRLHEGTKSGSAAGGFHLSPHPSLALLSFCIDHGVRSRRSSSAPTTPFPRLRGRGWWWGLMQASSRKESSGGTAQPSYQRSPPPLPLKGGEGVVVSVWSLELLEQTDGSRFRRAILEKNPAGEARGKDAASSRR